MAVYTKVTTEEAAGFLQRYDLGSFVALQPIAQGIENSNYFLDTAAGRYVLTLFEKRVRSEDLPFFLGLMEHLANKGLSCPLPVKDKSGEAKQQLKSRPACLVTHLHGESLVMLDVRHCMDAGRALASLHLAGIDSPWQRPNDMGLACWLRLLAACDGRTDVIQTGLAATLQQELDFLSAHWPHDLPKGIIHADMFPDNVFFQNNQLCGIFDFYFACSDLYAYDLAITMNAWCFEQPHSFNVTKAQALVQGYQTIRPLSKAEINALPLLARGASIRFLMTRIYDWLHPVPDALVKPKNPLDYLTRLRFHQQVKSASAYGCDL